MSQTDEQKGDVETLLKGITEIEVKTTSSSILSVFGSQAFPLAVRKHRGGFHPIAAGARFGDGRIIIFGADDFLTPKETSTQLKVLLVNSVQWLTAGKSAPPKIGILDSNEATKQFLEASGFKMIPFATEAELSMDGIDLLWIKSISKTIKTENQIKLIKTFIKNGGGLIASDYSEFFRGDIRYEHPGNQITGEAGLVWSQTSAYDSNPTYASTLAINRAELVKGYAPVAWDSIFHQSRLVKYNLTDAEFKNFTSVLVEFFLSVSAEDTHLLPKITDRLTNEPILNEEVRKSANDSFSRSIAQIHLFRRAVNAKGGGATTTFPGDVTEGTPRLKDQTLQLNLNNGDERWHSTGLYAAPGELITFEFNPPLITNYGVKVQIGCHNDDITKSDEYYKRCPLIVRNKKVATGSDATTLSNPFGGLIYITANQKIGEVKCKISGGIEAPYFVLGKTTLSEWQSRLRSLGAPWGELENSRVILTLPSRVLTNLDDPEALLKVWEQVLDAEADLATIPKERPRPERIVADVEIAGGGYMHSGYPIMTPVDESIETATDIKKLKSPKGWGHFHELGHNHQQGDWTPGVAVEVNCNLFSMYVYETVCELTPEEAHENLAPEKQKEGIRKYIEKGAKYSEWGKDSWTALLFYYQLKKMFGWDGYKKVFEEYKKVTNENRPRGDEEKWDMWLTTFSKTVGVNLSPLFDSWGFPITEGAKESVKDLPPTDQTIHYLLK